MSIGSRSVFQSSGSHLGGAGRLASRARSARPRARIRRPPAGRTSRATPRTVQFSDDLCIRLTGRKEDVTCYLHSRNPRSARLTSRQPRPASLASQWSCALPSIRLRSQRKSYAPPGIFASLSRSTCSSRRSALSLLHALADTRLVVPGAVEGTLATRPGWRGPRSTTPVYATPVCRAWRTAQLPRST